MKLRLIYPTHRQLDKRRLFNVTIPFNLCLLAAQTPEDVDVSLTDAYLDDINYDEPVDLVGITCLTPNAIQAYKIADKYRDMGVKVVLGGIHPTALPQESLEHADAVIVGEAEGVWKRVISDFRAGRHIDIYRSDRRPDLEGMPVPRRDLCRQGRYLLRNLVETSRGCPFDCMYCSDSVIFGEKYRFRPIDEVIEEIKSIGKKFIVFIDNNICCNLSRSKELFEALIPLNVRWVAQTSIAMGYDEELIKLAARSGCLGVLIGLETLNKELLRIIGKPVEPEKYIENIGRIKRHGIFVQGEFIFGFDQDSPGIFETTLDFAKKAKLDAARFAILKPYPGTRIFDKFNEEGRILTRDWEKYHTKHVVFKPKQLTPEQLSNGRDWAYEQFSSISSIYSRIGFRGKRAPLLWLINLANSGFKNTRGTVQPVTSP